MLSKDLIAGGVKSNIASLALIHIGNYLIPLITIPLILRSLGLEDFGRYSFLLSLCLYLSILIEFGLTIPATKYASENRGDVNLLSSQYFNVIAIKVFFTIICLALLVFSSMFIDLINDNLSVLIILYGVVLSQAISPAWIYVGIECAKPYAMSVAISKILYLALLIVFSESIDV